MTEPLPKYPWPGPFQVELPSGDKVTVTLYHQPEKGGRPIVVIEDKKLEELSAEDRSHILTIALEVQQAAPGYFYRSL
jgi:hypothetical protein